MQSPAYFLELSVNIVTFLDSGTVLGFLSISFHILSVYYVCVLLFITHTYIHTHRKIDTQTYTHRHTDIQADRQKHTQTHMHAQHTK